MAVSEIKAKLGTSTALTISLASLASSASGLVARQSTFVDNTTDRFGKIRVYVKVKAGTTPTVNKGIYAFLLTADKVTTPNTTTDGAGTTDAGITIVSAEQIPYGSGSTTTTTGQLYQWSFIIHDPGPAWAIAIGHDMVAALDSTGGNHGVWYVGINPEAQ